MKAKIEIKSLFLGVLVGAAVVLSVVAATRSGPSTWEYRVLDQYKLVEQGLKRLPVIDNLEPVVNRAAKEGWEVVCYTDGEGGPAVMLRRRTK